MGRPFYPHEADDPDLDWLVSNFLYERPDYFPVEAGMLPLLLLPYFDDFNYSDPTLAASESPKEPVKKSSSDLPNP